MKGYEKLRAAGLSDVAAQSAALCAQGLSNQEIADKRFLSIKTIKWHLNTTYKTLGIKTRAQLIVWVMNNS